MEEVSNVAQNSWEGTYNVTLDHKSGFHKIRTESYFWDLFRAMQARRILRLESAIQSIVLKRKI